MPVHPVAGPSLTLLLAVPPSGLPLRWVAMIDGRASVPESVDRAVRRRSPSYAAGTSGCYGTTGALPSPPIWFSTESNALSTS